MITEEMTKKTKEIADTAFEQLVEGKYTEEQFNDYLNSLEAYANALQNIVREKREQLIYLHS